MLVNVVFAAVMLTTFSVTATAQMCPNTPQPGSEGISASITDANRNTPMADGMIIKPGTRLRLDAIAWATGTCQGRAIDCTNSPCVCVNTNLYRRQVAKINMWLDARTGSSINGRYVAGYVFGVDGNGRTISLDVMNTRASDTTGPQYETLYAPGTYKFSFQAIIHRTICNLLPSETEVKTITVHVRDDSGDGGNNGAPSTVVGWPSIASTCGGLAKQRPDPEPISHLAWSMMADVTDRDGLVLRNVTLNGRHMAESIGIPYFTLETSALPRTRGELKPFSEDSVMRSRLVGYEVFNTDPDRLQVTATYQIDRLPGGSQSCIHVAQRYEFFREGYGGRCEPSGTIPCARWRAAVRYKFNGRGGELLKAFNVAQRHHFRVQGRKENTVGLFRDCDTPPLCVATGGGPGFQWKRNPLETEFESQVIIKGRDARKLDNMHQTHVPIVDQPSISPGHDPELHLIGGGCPECVHIHWRWTAFLGPKWNNGRPLIPEGSDQDLDIAVLRFRDTEAEIHPENYLQLFNSESIRKFHLLSPPIGMPFPRIPPISMTTPEEVVSWFSYTGHMDEDSFFFSPAWFNPAYKDRVATITGSLQDGPTSIYYSYLYREALPNNSKSVLDIGFGDRRAVNILDLPPNCWAKLPRPPG